jgi:hypothetical protein
VGSRGAHGFPGGGSWGIRDGGVGSLGFVCVVDGGFLLCSDGLCLFVLGVFGSVCS